MFGILHRIILSRVISFLHCTLLVTLVFIVSCFRLWFLTVVPVSNTLGKTPPVPGSTIRVSMGYASIHNLAIPRVLLTTVERAEIWLLERATIQKTCDIS